MPNPFPIAVTGADGITVLVGEATFTDEDNQPGGDALPTGWTKDTPNVGDFSYAANSRTALIGPAGDPTDPDSGLEIELVCIAGSTYRLIAEPGSVEALYQADIGGSLDLSTASGIESQPHQAGTAAFTAGGGGATAALDCGALPVINLPTVDPGIAGALWNDAGTPAISAG